jgi:hypothetical protein
MPNLVGCVIVVSLADIHPPRLRFCISQRNHALVERNMAFDQTYLPARDDVRAAAGYPSLGRSCWNRTPRAEKEMAPARGLSAPRGGGQLARGSNCVSARFQRARLQTVPNRGTRQNPREEPGALAAHAGICAACALQAR